jgi:hypothetical protein
MNMSCEFTSKSALNVLCELQMEEKRRKYPSTPENYLVKPNYSDKTANGLTKCIISFSTSTAGRLKGLIVLVDLLTAAGSLRLSWQFQNHWEHRYVTQQGHGEQPTFRPPLPGVRLKSK